MITRRSLALVCAAVICLLTVVAHMSCLFLGPECFEAQLAPTELVQSAVQGTLLAPIATIIVSSLFFTCAMFALSGAGMIRALPWLKLVLFLIAIVFMLRGIVTFPALLIYQEYISATSVVAGIIWLITGLLFYTGYKNMH